MSFKIGQINSSNRFSGDAVTIVPHKIIDFKRTSELSSSTTFIDKQIVLGESENSNKKFQSDTYYYIQLAIAKFGQTNQELTFQLSNGTSDNITETQYINNVVNYKAARNYKNTNEDSETNQRKFSIFEMIISPNDNYERLEIMLSRNLFDYIEQEGDNPTESPSNSSNSENQGSSPIEDEENYLNHLAQKSYKGRQLIIDENNCYVYEINNLIENGPWNKIGIQGPSGMLCCINGEGIRVGPSGIYQLKNSNYNITFLGIIPHISSDIYGNLSYDNFIIDYQYDFNQGTDTTDETEEET